MSVVSERLTNYLGTTERATDKTRFDASGVLLIDKPSSITSMDVIRVLRRLARFKKIGHGGTLDPLATGVLPILINDGTRLSDRVMSSIKEYEGSFLLGQSFDTQDITGQPTSELKSIPTDMTREALQKAASTLEGQILQIPPQYSAVKKHGRPLYEYARDGKTVEVEARPVTIEKFEIREYDGDRRCTFFCRVQKGAYVRTLIHDLGQRIGVGAALETLCRTQTGPFHLDEAIRLETLVNAEDLRENLKPLTLFN